ncbi:transglutaminase-like domain-containing protein [Anaerovorax odorimutans]|uniref:transglutaminase-like domain-containing protein n=1 Tax=Anaerovorax odorimutans TaxID=109327 RepID=UPI00041DBBF2|nr:transglutaminase-like domain-containing protein [Anaerovorax odorimutans]
MKRKALFIMLVLVFILAFSIISNADNYFDTSQVDKGIINVSCNTDKKAKIIIKKGEEKYIYDIKNDGTKESFPLQMGNGTYNISLLENTSASYYKMISSTTVDINLKDPNSVYLNSVQNINWSQNKLTVAKASSLTSGTSDIAKKAEVLWDYIIKNNIYDYNKSSSLSKNYIPIPDLTLKQQSGICYDFSSLFAAMLRSEGTPAKLVTGYAPKNAVGYHAWNEIYDTKNKQWMIIDTTYDLQVYAKTKKASMKKDASDFKKVYEY